MKLLIADNNNPRRVGLLTIAKSCLADFRCYEASNISDMLAQLRIYRFDRILISVSIIGADIKQTIFSIKSILPRIKILLIADNKDSIPHQFLFNPVTNGVICSESTLKDLYKAIHIFCLKGEYRPINLSQYTTLLKNKKFPFAKLSKNEQLILDRLLTGIRIIELSKQMNISTSTISTYRKRALQKLNVSNIAEVIALMRNKEKYA